MERETSLEIAKDLYLKNKLSEDSKNKVVSLGRDFVAAYNIAVNALLKVQLSNMESDEATYLEKMTTVSDILSDLVGFVNELLEKSNESSNFNISNYRSCLKVWS